MLKLIFEKIGRFFATVGTMLLIVILKNKAATSAVALVVALAVVLTCIFTAPKKATETAASKPSAVIQSSSQVATSSVSSLPSSSKVTTSVAPSSKVNTPEPVQKPQAPVATQNQNFKYNSNLDIEDNVFMDSMVYTGYNLAKHRADGRMWTYILASRKRGMGYLSNISYGGGSTGYETVDGKPDLKAFARGGLVCASYVTYVYFNYLPNVAGIDTSSLPRPVDSHLASDWYAAANKWVELGYSRKIPFTAKKNSSNYIVFNPAESIPIGSIIIFCTVNNVASQSVNWNRKSHVAIYGGYKNGYNWIYHVGNENGPEMCAIERVLYGPDPQWPFAVITPPSNIRMSAMLSVSAKDSGGAPIANIPITAKNNKTGATVALGKTDAAGIAKKENLKYGKYTVSFTVPEGYTAEKTSIEIELTPKNNSSNTLNIVLSKKPQVTPSVPAEPPTVTSN